jgi:NitT/TauT family transport system substrate-binding protein
MPRIVSLLLGLMAVSLSTLANAETLKVAVSQRGFWDSTMVDIAEKQGFFKEAGLEIEILYTEGGLPR